MIVQHATNESGDSVRELERLRADLLAHPVYAAVDGTAELATFMESHVFAVWDFMTLLKALQRRLTCVDVPWVPTPDPHAARLINGIVLAEESDLLADGSVVSHFELYLVAMRDVGARTDVVEAFVDAIRAGRDPGIVLRELSVPEDVRAFVGSTLAVAREGTLEEIAAYFLHGREDPIPAMFDRLLACIPAGASAIRTYLARHVEVDAGEHGPAAHALLERLIGASSERRARALGASRRAIRARIALWDGLLPRVARAGNPLASMA